MQAQSLFARSYAHARELFRGALSDRGVPFTAYTNPHGTGPDGETLTTDVAVLGPPNAHKAVVIQSGTHGVEGYAGSGCQTGFLRDPQFAKLPADTRIVLIHALNAHGFAWNRRVNEDNVDLNRNFVDHSLSHPENPGYEALIGAIEVADLKPDTLARADGEMRNYAKKHGAFALQEAVARGQYRHAKGLYFGGRRETWSAGLFKHLMRRELAGCGRIAVVDVHTGLGPYGYGELISEESADSPAYRRARSWWGDTVRSTKAGESVSSDVMGSVDSALPALLPHAEVTACALEYGTYDVIDVFTALRADNWLHAHGDVRGQGAGEIKAQIRRAFFPDCGDWKDMVWARAAAVFAQAIDGVRAS